MRLSRSATTCAVAAKRGKLTLLRAAEGDDFIVGGVIRLNIGGGSSHFSVPRESDRLRSADERMRYARAPLTAHQASRSTVSRASWPDLPCRWGSSDYCALRRTRVACSDSTGSPANHRETREPGSKLVVICSPVREPSSDRCFPCKAALLFAGSSDFVDDTDGEATKTEGHRFESCRARSPAATKRHHAEDGAFTHSLTWKPNQTIRFRCLTGPSSVSARRATAPG